MPEGDTQVIDVADTSTTEVHACPPIVTVAPEVEKELPVIVTGVPPTTFPVLGEIDVIVGVDKVGGVKGPTIFE